MNPRGGRPRASIVTGICIGRDAISNSVLLERDILTDAGWDVRVFTQFTDVLDPPDVVVTEHPWAIHREAHFSASELIIYHFGTHYSLFNALVVPHPTARSVVRFHNVTPPELLAGAARRSAERAQDQLGALLYADAVWCDSEFNRRCLDQLALDPSRVSVMELCVPWLDETVVATPAVVDDRPVRLVYVGRFVAAKGVHDLIEAVDRLDLDIPWELDLIGNPTNSDRGYLDGLVDRLTGSPLAEHVRVSTDVDDEELRVRLLDADVFVVPSYHEGFCVPVIEAMGAGCRVVGTTAGALPETIGSFGRLVGPGDVVGLAEVLASEISAVRSAEAGSEPRRRADEHDAMVARFGRGAFTTRLLQGIEALAELPPRSPVVFSSVD